CTGRSATLKSLGEKAGPPAYPAHLRKRARINERMDWLNTQFYRDFGYGLVYPQIFPNLRRPNDEVQAGTIAWGKEKAEGWLKILDENLIGPKNGYLCGTEISLADYLGAPYLTVGEIVRCNYSRFPNITRWLGNMKRLPTWEKVNKPFYDLVASVKGTEFVAV